MRGVIHSAAFAACVLMLSQNGLAQSSSTSAEQMSATTAPAATAPAATVNASVAEVSKAATKKTVVEFSTVNRVGVRDANTNQGRVNAENTLGMKYKIDDTRKVGFVQPFIFDHPSKDEPLKVTVHNLYLMASDSKIATLPGNWNVSGLARLYLPTGEPARFTNKNLGALRYYNMIGKDLAPSFTLTHYLIGQIDFQSQDGWLSDGGATRNQNRDWWWAQYVELAYQITPMVSISQEIGTANYYYRAFQGIGRGDGLRQDNATFNTYVNITNPVPGVIINIGMESAMDYRNARTEDGGMLPYSQRNTKYIAALTAAL